MELGFQDAPYLSKRWPNRSVYTFTNTLNIYALKRRREKREEEKKGRSLEAEFLS